ncbi:MGMT family protein [Algoriphagus chordae]|uniref:Methylated-DNA-protein-cysteine methyltransferase-like protein n=1 Tax=Algoriphagus chordae TaxID=237019 RepID=A0A2W7RC86_9BACT|nr:MGMT family protein [Algoriphagus chordae]PZX56726.1 methylated-DNA-protein-cysteine methyltransferase-like protein [Algoriphagus chordae]
MKPEKPNYFDLVYQVVRLIPSGRVTNYGSIAQYLGIKSGARMVGYAMNAAHTMADVPAHRVVNSQGLLTGKEHFETSTKMQELLEKEGVKVVKDKVQNFDKVYWNPDVELAL